MSLEVTITGAATFSRVAAQVRAEGSKDLSRALGRALEKVTDPVKKSISAEADKVMPSGYKELLTGSLRHRASRRNGGQQAQLIIRTYADGTKERRDVVALEKGVLRHPLFGRSRKIKTGVKAGTVIPNPWYVTSITPGFHRRGTELAAEEAEEALAGVVEDFAARLIK